MRKAMTLLIVIILACTTVWAGATKEEGVAATTGTPKDTLVIGVAQEINEQNPMMQNDQINNNCFVLTHERLIFVDSNNGYLLSPELAESWEWKDDTHLVFHLFKTIKFNNGTPLTAADVAFTLNRARSNDPTKSKISGTLKLITDVSALDDYTVQITTSAFSNELIYNLGAYPLVIQSKAAYEDPANKAPWLVGTGPYRFKEWKEGQYVTYEKRDDYWNAAKEPSIASSITFRFLLEASQRVIALQNGEIDVCIDPPTTDLKFLKEDANITVHTQAGTRLFYLSFNVEKAPFDNQKLRQAVSCAIDKQTIVDIVLDGRGKWQTSVLNRGAWSFLDNDQVEGGYAYDVARAKALLAEAGYQPGQLTVELFSATDDPYKTIAPIVQANLKEIGINVVIKSMDQATLKTECANGHQQLFLWRWNIGARVDETYRELFYTNFPTNYAQLKDAYVDQMADKVLTEKDPEKRLQYSHELQNYFVELVPQVPLYVPDLVIAYKKGLKGAYLTGGGAHDWSRAYIEQ
ncbi:MAG: ABC transporter substrate-binding protein [Sphaerochaetaceae bacterium]|nr:ABC transporter substrate-binding protein [Sphaerochaetaceae bacterium]